MTKAVYLALLLLLLFSSASLTAEENPCSEVEDAQERLKCFDNVFPAETEVEVAATQVENAEPAEPEQASVALDPPVSERLPISERLEEQPAEAKTKRRRGLGWFSASDNEETAATIIDLLNKDKQKMVFQLDNDQIWIQSSPRNLPIKAGEKVTIKSARLGGYVMRTENGVSTRVSRLTPRG